MSEQTSESYEFGRFRVRADDRVLMRGGELVPLTPKAFDILLALLEKDGRIVNKDDLMKKVWPHTFVEEGNLTQNVSLLRKALGESAHGPQFIETVPRRGYRFVAPVTRVNGNGQDVRGNRESNEPEVKVNETDNAPSTSSSTTPEQNRTDGKNRLWTLDFGRWTSFSRRLPAVVLALAAVAATVLGIAYLSGRGKAGASPTAIQSIAVLPFVDDSPGGGADFLDDEIAASLVNSLTKLPKLRVVPRSVMVTYKGRNVDPRQVGQELNVRAVVTGRIHRRGDTISIQADLIDLENVSQIWGQHYERRLSDMLLVQEEISRDIFENLRLKLNVEEQKQLEAYRLYLKGRNAWNKRTREGMEQGIEFFQQAINADPNYAAAYAGLADCYNMQVIYGVHRPKDGFPKAKEAAIKALEMDDTLAEAHTSLAFINFRWDRDRAAAEREFLLAIKHKPTYAPAHQWYSSYLVALERFDEAVAEAKRTSELEPLSFTASSHLGWIYYLSGRNDEAIAQCSKILSLDPNSFPARRYLGLAYEQKGMYPQAIEEFQKGVKLSGSPLMLALLGHAYAASGKTAEARQVLTDLHDLSESGESQKAESQRYVSPYTVAAIYTALGEKDQAFKWLERAYEERDVWLMNLKVDPVFARLRSDKRFQDLLTRARLRP
jgi:DNA-binding winged helix-turn-helix (wHTH) protein/TolB-like protein/Tfp pilus assembly protein PilF